MHSAQGTNEEQRHVTHESPRQTKILLRIDVVEMANSDNKRTNAADGKRCDGCRSASAPKVRIGSDSLIRTNTSAALVRLRLKIRSMDRVHKNVWVTIRFGASHY